uniref:Bm425 n=1 Tax=Brugia malayi TaxID=6279 RepID=A0A1I9GDF7_BRUMA|nr:Bm425 [Brugia malayi]
MTKVTYLQKLLGNIQHQRTIIKRSSSEIICQNLFLALSFVILLRFFESSRQA